MELLLIIVVSIHLLAVNLAGAGPLVVAWADWRGGRRGQIELQDAALSLARWSILATAVGVGLGLGALAVLIYWPPVTHRWYLNYLRVVPVDRWCFTGAEIVFYIVCMCMCVIFWVRLQRRPWLRRLLAIAAGTNFLYHFPALFTILAITFERHITGASGRLDRQFYHQMLFDPETIARVLHVWLASFATSGLALSWIGARTSGNDRIRQSCGVSVAGGRLALGATLLQVPAGVWVYLTLPTSQTDRIMTVGALVMFALSIFCALGLMHQLAMLSLGDVSRRRLSVATLFLIVVVTLMTATLYSSRPH